MKSIAMVYASTGHPEMAYMTSLRTGIEKNADDSFKVVTFSCSVLDRDCLSERNLIYISTRLNTLKRLFMFMVLSPVKFYKYVIGQIGRVSAKEILKSWAKFAPLLITELDVIHLTQAGLFKVFPKDFPFNKLIVSFLGADLTLRPLYSPEWVALLRDDLFPRADCLHFISNFLRDESLRYGGKLEKSKLIHIGIDSNLFQPPIKISKNKKIIITTTGRLIWNKGHIYVLRAIKILKDAGHDIQYNIIGDGEAYTEIYFWRGLLNLEENVVMLGYLRLDEKLKYLQTTDIYIQPSTIDEGLCVTVLEAMAMGLPVVATIAGGIPDMVKDQETGLLVPRADYLTLADAILKLVVDKDLRCSMGEAGRKRIKEHFSLQQEINAWVELYTTL